MLVRLYIHTPPGIMRPAVMPSPEVVQGWRDLLRNKLTEIVGEAVMVYPRKDGHPHDVHVSHVPRVYAGGVDGGLEEKLRQNVEAHVNRILESGGIVDGDLRIKRVSAARSIPKPPVHEGKEPIPKPPVVKLRPQQKLPVFQRDLDFVIRIPKNKVHLISGGSAGLLEEVEKTIRREYRQLKRQGQPIKNINAPHQIGKGVHGRAADELTRDLGIGIVRDTSFRNDPRFQAGIRSNSKALPPPPSMQARRHYVNDAIFESELQNLKSKAIMPNETTLVLPAGSFNPHMFYLMLDLYEGANKGQDSASVGFEKFKALPTRDTMPIQIKKDPISDVAADAVESSVAHDDGADSDKGMSPWVIGGISVGVLALIYGAYQLGRNR